MFKNDFSGNGLIILCDHCRRTIDARPFKFAHERINSPKKDKGAGQGRILDFCDEKCRIVFFRGRKYYQRKLKYIADNEVINDRRMNGN